MRVLVIGRGIPDNKNPLMGIFEYAQAKALAQTGVEVIYAGLDLRSIRHRRRLGIHQYRADGMDIFTAAVPVGALGKALRYIVGRQTFALLYRRIEKRTGRPDIIHVHFGGLAQSVWKLCRKENIPLVITEHSSVMDASVLAENEKRRRKAVYSHAAAVIAVSGSLKEKIKQHTGVQALVIPNMADMPEITAQECGSGEFHFVSAGKLIRDKGFDVLLRAFALLCEKKGNCTLTVMGDGEEREKLETLCAQLGVADKVRFSGKYDRSELATQLSAAQAFVLASRHETFGVVYIEALYCGRPVIATRCGGPEEFVNGNNGLLVEKDNANALAEAMIKLTDNIGQYDSDKIKREAEGRFSPCAVAEQIISVYRGILDK